MGALPPEHLVCMLMCVCAPKYGCNVELFIATHSMKFAENALNTLLPAHAEYVCVCSVLAS